MKVLVGANRGSPSRVYMQILAKWLTSQSCIPFHSNMTTAFGYKGGNSYALN